MKNKNNMIKKQEQHIKVNNKNKNRYKNNKDNVNDNNM
jgi:hypothetical protein